jgi:predicted short-subunit dehydrogenase-like oxidoreductase (DUF2520 family)
MRLGADVSSSIDEYVNTIPIDVAEVGSSITITSDGFNAFDIIKTLSRNSCVVSFVPLYSFF